MTLEEYLTILAGKEVQPKMRMPNVFLALFAIALVLQAIPSFPSVQLEEAALSEGEGDIVIIEIKYVEDGKFEIVNSSKKHIKYSGEVYGALGTIGGTGEYSTVTFVDGERTGEFSFDTGRNIKQGFSTSIFMPIPDGAQGKTIETAIEKNGRITERERVVYCGDKTCSKGERVTTCPSDCILGGLSPQQGSKKVPYIAAGLFLLIVSGAILYIVTKKGQ